MIKSTLLSLLALFLFSISAHAQFTTIARGVGFEEPETGYAKLLLMKNGNTAYLHITHGDGIKIKMYSPEYKQIFTYVADHDFGKLKGLQVEGCLETEGNITILLSEVEGRIPVLYRIVLNGQDGKIVSQETIATLKKLSLGQGYAAAFGGVPLPDFIVRRDPYSENYVVASFNSFASERDKRVEVVHYNSKNEIISKSYLSTPDNKYKYINILDICVFEDKESYALIYAYNTASSGGKEADLILAKFTKNNNEVEYKTLEIEEGLKVNDAIMKFNRKTKGLHILSHTEISTKQKASFFKKQNLNSTFMTLHYIYDISKGSVVTRNEIDFSDVDKKYKELFGPKTSYSGVLQNFYINDDGGYSIIFEGLEVIVTQRSSSSGMSSTSTQYMLGDLAVLNYSDKGVLSSSTLVPKSQMLNNSIMSGGGGVTASPLYHAKRDFTAQWLKGGNQYKSFSYLNGKSNNYILLNDILENEKHIQKGKLTTIKSVKDCDGFSFVTNGNDLLPSRKFVLGNTNNKNNQLAIFSISDYDREKDIYVTLKLDVDGRDTKVKVVWLKPG
ncbi:MAG TPA: hypothetical protein PLU17_01310 [Chitinophagaceae bacterium]|nr:hypothetical protein [Chitinophagaceae bacterium]